MSKLYSPTGGQAVTDQIRSFAHSQGIKDPVAIKKLQADVGPRIGKLVGKYAGTDAEARKATEIILRHSLKTASGEERANLNQQAFADLKSRHPSNTSVTELVHATNAWLKDTDPETHKALQESEGLGSHPFFVRKVTDAFEAHKAADRPYKDTYLKATVNAQAAEAVKVPGGMLGAKP